MLRFDIRITWPIHFPTKVKRIQTMECIRLSKISISESAVEKVLEWIFYRNKQTWSNTSTDNKTLKSMNRFHKPSMPTEDTTVRCPPTTARSSIAALEEAEAMKEVCQVVEQVKKTPFTIARPQIKNQRRPRTSLTGDKKEAPVKTHTSKPDNLKISLKWAETERLL